MWQEVHNIWLGLVKCGFSDPWFHFLSSPNYLYFDNLLVDFRAISFMVWVFCTPPYLMHILREKHFFWGGHLQSVSIFSI